MASYRRQTEAALWDYEEFEASFDIKAYERSVLWPQITQLGRPGNKIHKPKFDNLSSVVFTDVPSSTGVTFVANTETEFVATARARILPVELLKTQMAEMKFDPKNDVETALPKSVGSGIDSDVLALAAALATNIVGDPAQNLGFDMIADAHQKLVTGALEYFEPREQSRGICVVAATQDDDLISIDKITNAQIRGDRMNPLVSGWVATAVGIDFYESTNVSTAGGFANNIMLIPRALAIGFNQKPTVGRSEYQVIYDQLVAWASYAYGTMRDEYAVLIKTLST